jgi:ribosome-associated protein
MIEIDGCLVVGEEEIEESFVQGSGPGGQNVNKVATAVLLKFDLTKNWRIGEGAKQRLARLAGRRLTREGVIVIQANRFRTQERNRADARERLAALIAAALVPPPPARVPTRPTRGSKERRLEGKRERARVKEGRASPRDDG